MWELFYQKLFIFFVCLSHAETSHSFYQDSQNDKPQSKSNEAQKIRLKELLMFFWLRLLEFSEL